MTHPFNFLSTQIGSMPHTDAPKICDWIASSMDIPVWPQLPRLSFRESMYIQYSTTLPAIVLDEVKEKIYFNTQGDIASLLEKFYELYLADDVDAFALQREYAAGFFAMLDSLKKYPGQMKFAERWVKGQVTGPISFGLTVTDQDLRASLYDEMLVDVIVKNMAMNARWQIRQLKVLRPNVIIFVDEPYMASFGSAYISLSREQVITMLDEVYDAIHAEGGLGGVHCCANTDWSVLMSTKVDVLNLDAFGYIDNLALYPNDLRTFLDRGSVVAWGIVPTNEEVFQTTPQALADRLRKGIENICLKSKARGISINSDDFKNQSLVSPSCGLGSSGMEVADRAIEVLLKTAEILKKD